MPSMPAAVRTALGTCVLASTAFTAQAAPFKDLHDFTATPDGREPHGSVLALDGLLYGTTTTGGTSDAGVIYSLDPATNKEKVLYSFTGTPDDGTQPMGELVAVDGILYGTTAFGGEFGAGTIFRFDPATGVEKVLHSFSSAPDGRTPIAGLAVIGNALIGTTGGGGGASDSGTIFEFDLDAMQEKVIHQFAGGDDDGNYPYAPLVVVGPLVYGTTYKGGHSDSGTVFKYDPRNGVFTVMHAFSGDSSSGNPVAGLVFDNDYLYGVTSKGGQRSCGGDSCGTVFRVNVNNRKEKTLYRFKSSKDGFDPEGGLVLDDGKLYGTTVSGGRGKSGTLFSIDLRSGTKTTLHNFKFPTGAQPGTLVEVDGTLYGTTFGGGGAAQGTLFRYRP